MAAVNIPTDKKAAVITVNVDDGTIIDIQGINGAIQNRITLEELTRSYATKGVGYDTIAWIIHAHSSPGCVRIIGGTVIELC